MRDEQKSRETQGIKQQGKRDFMKTVGAGLGLAGLASLMGSQAMAADGNNNIDFVEKQGADWLMKNIPGAAVVWL